LQATGNGAAQDAVLAGTGTAAAMNLGLPPAVDLGVVNLGSSSTGDLSVQNVGTEPVSISGFAVTGTNAGDFTIWSDQCPPTLAVGQTCNIGLTFTPTGGNERTATVQITDNATGSPQAVALSGIGQTAAQTLALPAGLDFGVVPLGSSPTSSFYVYNTGTATVTISKIAITGVNPTDFAVSLGCTQINPGYGCPVEIIFSPSAAGLRTAVLGLTDGAVGSPQSMPLTGVAQAAIAVIAAPVAVSFPAVALGSSYSQTFGVYDTGNVAVNFSGEAITGTNASDFAINSFVPSLAPGSTAPMEVTFTPTASGVRTASLQFTDNATGSPQSISLTGVGDAATAILTVPSAVEFPDTVLGSSNTQHAKVQNFGNQIITIRSMQVSGPNASDFSIASGCPPLAAGYGNTCSIPIVFTPAGSGVRTATLKLTDNAAGSPQSISLTGVGQAPTASLDPTPSSLTFGPVAVGSSEGPDTGSVYNTGDANVSITGLSITGPNAGDFAIYTNSCILSLVPGAFCQYQIIFVPTATGPRNATLQIADDAVGSPNSWR
jgi:hypothetical protein